MSSNNEMRKEKKDGMHGDFLSELKSVSNDLVKNLDMAISIEEIAKFRVYEDQIKRSQEKLKDEY